MCQKKVLFVFTLVCCLVSCGKNEKSEGTEAISSKEKIVINEGSIGTTSTYIVSPTEIISESAAEHKTTPIMQGCELPENVSSEISENHIDAFNYADFHDNEHDVTLILALDDNYVYLEKWCREKISVADLLYYKFDFTTGEITKFDGIIPKFHVSSGENAFVDGKIYSVIYGNESMRYSIDTQRNKVDLLERGNEWDDSRMRTVYTVGEDSYAEYWATGAGYKLTTHIILHDKNSSKEILTKEYNSKKERYVYTAGGGYIYEYAQDLDTIEPYLNIYNEKGDLESSEYLGEIAANLKQDPDSYVSDIHVSGRFIAFDMNFGESTAKSYIYDMEKKSFYLMDGCQSLTTPNYLPPDFGKIPFLLRDTSGEGTMFDLFCLYENGDIVKLVDNIGTNTMIIPNGGKIAYFNDEKELYTVEY